MMESFRRDVRIAVRAFAKRPAFAVVVVLSLALGIGANTATFSFVYALLLRPFPYEKPEQLVRVYSVISAEGGRDNVSSLRDVDEWARASRTISAIGAYIELDAEVQGDGPAEAIRMAQLNEGTLRLLGVQPVIGRLFRPDEDAFGGDVHKALIGYGLWKSRYGGDSNIVGKSLRTSRASFTIVGVMAPGFGFPGRVDVWTPLESNFALQTPQRPVGERTGRGYRVIARIKEGFTLRDAEADLNRVAALLAQHYPQDNAGVGVRLRSLRDAETGDIRPFLVMISTAAALVLLICCVNVAGLLLSRALSSRREFAVRTALGASRTQLVRASLTESLVLALAGGALGLGLAFVCVQLLLALIPVALPTWMRITVDGPALAFAFAVSITTTALFGLAPALLASRSNLHNMLKENSRSSTGGGVRVQGALVTAQLCLTLLLLVGAGLLTQTFLALRKQKTGFVTEGLLVARANNYRTGTRVERSVALSQYHQQVLDRLQAIPGITGVGGVDKLPYTRVAPQRSRANLLIRGIANGDMRLQVPVSSANVSPDYFETMGIPLVSGRLFDRRDTPQSPLAIIINERAAQTLWPGRDAVGQELYWGDGQPTPEDPASIVVGVVKNVRTLSGEDDNGLELYYPFTQYPIASTHYVLRTRGDPLTHARAVRQAIQSVDQNSPVMFVKSMDQIIDETLWQRRLWSVLLAAFGLVSLALAAIGVYGLLTYLVSNRTRELGLRLALGAQPSGIRAQVLLHVAKLFGIGLGAGIIGGLALQHLLAGLLFGVTAGDPVNILAAVVVLTAVTWLACYIPAQRASASDPLVALSED
jgi:putative ABC transport system permease protein